MDFRTIGVAGLGMLGRGIAACLLGHGLRVVAFTRSKATHRKARDYIRQAIHDLIERAGFPAELADRWPARYRAVDSLEPLADCDFVIETIVEDPAAKQRLFDELEAILGPGVPIASNTSALPITGLQRPRRHPERFVGMHWGEPAHVNRFLELIRGEQTSEAAFRAAEALGRAVGKEPSLVQKDVPAFIVNRLAYVMYREAAHLLDLGVADVETIDRSFRNAIGLWATMCGPFRWIDITGGPASYARTLQRVLPSCYNGTELPESLKRMIAEDAQGVINRRGFYHYSEDEVERWEKLFLEHAWNVRQLMDKYFPLAEQTDRDRDPTA